ncbi:MAG: outer membrane lipoprotein carrier protein LolA [Deltaproteobacteria bacterium]|nr:outer membrane lipoprotein carrier protein LolA [Deltaproteobacteria bacterium]
MQPRSFGIGIDIGTAVAIAVVIAAVLPGRSLLAAEDFRELRQQAELVKSIAADFTQTKKMKLLKKPLVSKGRFFYSAPEAVRWEYRSPIRTVSLVKGGGVKRYSLSAEGTWRADSSSAVEGMRIVMEQITGWLAGRFDDGTLFVASLAPGERPVVMLSPRDKEMARFISRVEVRFSNRPGVVEAVEIFEGESTSTLIEFSNVRLNEAVDGRLFEGVE